MPSQIAAMSGVPFKQQDAQSALGNGTVLALPPSFRNHTWLIIGSSGVSAGAVQIEASNDPADSATWGLVTAAPTTVLASTDILITVTGIFNFVRARISTAIVGGTVTVQYSGAKSY
ncbi:hypothetical protein HYZ97_03680 [Candidatus Pacearchaeota archaeon]|nr:hypothetical protein [Candidatus Pacearchaeota archaeon]